MFVCATGHYCKDIKRDNNICMLCGHGEVRQMWALPTLSLDWMIGNYVDDCGEGVRPEYHEGEAQRPSPAICFWGGPQLAVLRLTPYSGITPDRAQGTL